MSGSSLIVVHFFARWSGPSQMIKTELERLASHHPDTVFVEVDVDGCERIAERYEISTLPSFLLIQNHKVITTLTGCDLFGLSEQITRNK
ncbi:thioredoxin-2 isoform X2 [Eurytemora carolleeae]|nr:thioredoxin-2 isoform X2 [Eurytemora carolleeae]XP_023343387.1 thioredoxin-2 isoform X2 [Eurytemora carolleeae]XP_023343388.1 thioredoxin-2 isoform X2 [Eurytemora carolleeae]XP_023343390.1 thioredoxin-2 isoform X2 [Eurytemora carolleeae]|eukprot:XP_023343386.1 thioredoxin-2-like isoform X2 [Eurytemora affinis]